MTDEKSPPLVQIHKIQPPHYGSRLKVRGIVVSIGPGNPLIHEAIFRCDSCQALQTVLQPMGKFLAPKHCLSEGCIGKKSNFHRLDGQSTYIPSRIIKISETLFDDAKQEKKVASLDVHLTSDLVEECSLTDVVEITGKIIEPKTYKGQQVCGFYLWAEKVSKNPLNELTPNNIMGIKAIMSEENLLALLVASVCPTIPGNHLAKLAVLLTLAGGHEEDEECEASLSEKIFRGEIHLLLCGDPVQQKRELLKAAHNLALCSSYIDKSSTVSAVFDIISSENDHTLVAGPILQANKGICCIEDIDKIKQQRPVIVEIMDSEVFQTAKSAFMFTTPVNISILATCSPKTGSYDATKTLTENINLPQNMLNQFDLVLNLTDEQDTEVDLKYTSKVLSQGPISQTSQRSRNARVKTSDSLITKLSGQKFEEEDLIPPKLLSLYLQYVRKHIFPDFSEEAVSEIFDFNHDLQDRASNSTEMPGLDQTLRSLMRLAIARVRIEGRPHVTKQDALDIIDLARHTRFDLYPNDLMSSVLSRVVKRTANRPLPQVPANQPKRGRSSRERFIRHLQDHSRDSNQYIYTRDELNELRDASGFKTNNFGDMIAYLNETGYLLHRGSQKYELIIRD